MCTILKVLFRTNKTSPRRASNSKLGPGHAYHCPPFYVTRARQGRCQSARVSSLNGVGDGMHPRELVETIMRMCGSCWEMLWSTSSDLLKHTGRPVNCRVPAIPGRGRRRGGCDAARLHADIHPLQTCTCQRQQCLRAIWASTLNVVVKCGPCRHRRPQQHRLAGLAPMP